jgi:hypothetical protein
MNDRRDRPSLHDQSADQIRNQQRGGGGPVDDRQGRPEANDTMQKVWSEPGGEAYNFRNATPNVAGRTDGHTDLTASETPAGHIEHLSDATLKPEDRDAITEALARMNAAGTGKTS